MTNIIANDLGVDRAINRAGMPANFLIPVAATDIDAIKKHVGHQCIPVPRTRHGNAYLVKSQCGPKVSDLAIWQHERAEIISQDNQLWVDVAYSGYRKAYQAAFPNENIKNTVIHHVLNRRYASLHKFRYTRLVAISRSANSSSAFSENWGVSLTREGRLKERLEGEAIRYADISHIMPMLDMSVGGGVMENVCQALSLLKPMK